MAALNAESSPSGSQQWAPHRPHTHSRINGFSLNLRSIRKQRNDRTTEFVPLGQRDLGRTSSSDDHYARNSANSFLLKCGALTVSPESTSLSPVKCSLFGGNLRNRRTKMPSSLCGNEHRKVCNAVNLRVLS